MPGGRRTQAHPGRLRSGRTPGGGGGRMGEGVRERGREEGREVLGGFK